MFRSRCGRPFGRSSSVLLASFVAVVALVPDPAVAEERDQGIESVQIGFGSANTAPVFWYPVSTSR